MILAVSSVRDVDGEYDGEAEQRTGGEIDEQVALELLVMNRIHAALLLQLSVAIRTTLSLPYSTQTAPFDGFRTIINKRG